MAVTSEALGWLSGLDLWVLCLFAGLFIVMETTALVGLLVPGDVVVMLAGSTVQGPGQFAAVVAATIVGALVGESGGYLLGRRVGPRLRHGRLGRRVGDGHWVRAEGFLAGRGAPVLVPLRFVSVVHAVAPLVAGTVRMPYRRFAAWSAVGAVVWSLLYTGVGVVAGVSYRENQRVTLIAMAVALVCCAAVPLVRRLVRAS
ncbi:DedA family protein [Pseudonocardia acaciae]|uniref:DedA family protein n=1 Tax=Pseudonocardia acaciae TaxID=551276 RepID=UPI0012ED5341|nr:VTT domain-containing protein [Pseudonocardia acaciae]